MARRLTCALLLLALAASPTSADVCSAGCAKGSQGGYKARDTYTYWVEGEARVHLSGADKQETGVKISGQATVVGLGNCANYLKISSLMITGPDGTQYGKPAGVEKPVRFTLEDGALGSEICAEEGDGQASLNIKRAILSMLQTSAATSDRETDVFGVCPAAYSVRQDAAGTLVSKTKNLNACAKREHGLISTYVDPKANLPQTSVMQSTLHADALVKNGIVDKAEAHEEYLYVPFSTGAAGARASVATKIQLKATNKGEIEAKCVVPRSIIFDSRRGDSAGPNNIANIQLALHKASQTMGNVVDASSASVFANLVRVLRGSSKSDVTNIYNQIKGGSSLKNNKLTRRVFLDALFRTGTGESVEFTIGLIRSGDLTQFEKNIALLSLTTIVHATPGALKAAISLLDTPDLPDEVYLGVGALAGVYCREHGCHGPTNSHDEVTQLSRVLLKRLHNCKATSKSTENTIMFALKAIKNIQHIDDCLIDQLASCVADKTVSTRVRVAALETYSADPCIPKLKQTALQILKDTNQDSELRINAYLALLRCPCNKVAAELKTMMQNEPVYQVGSFISSSLRNIRASANPAYDVAKRVFGDIKVGKEYPIDVMRYSQNYEMSVEQGTFGVGSFAEANVIYSQNSFIPRSSSLNLTTELFGSNVNLLEVGFRQGNLERVMEHFLGPHGVFNTETPQKLYDGIKQKTDSVLDKLKQRMEKARQRRAAVLYKQQTARFGQKLKTGVEAYSGDFELDIFMRLLGSDTLFLSLGAADKPASIESLIDKFFDYIDSGITDAKDFSHEIRSHLLFLDIETAYPTSMGVALKLNGEGASTTKMLFSSNTDFKKCLNDPKNAQIDVKLVPSANVELSLTITFDADVVATGLKVMSSLHTSTGAHVVAKLLNDGKGFDIKVDLPNEKVEILSLSHDIVFVERPRGHMDVEKPLKFDKKDASNLEGCFDQLSNAVGLTLCGSLSVPWLLSHEERNRTNKVTKVAPKGPLSGPAKFSVYLEKNDLTGFHIVGTVDDKNEHQQTAELTFEALGSKMARKVSFKTDRINRDDLKSLKATFVAPGKQIGATAAYTNNQKEKSLFAEWKYDQEHYKGKVGVNTAAARGKELYTPIFDIDYPGAPKDIQVTGTLESERKGEGIKVTFNKLAVSSKKFNFNLDGWVTLEPKMSQVNLKLKTNEETSTLIGKSTIKKIGENDNVITMDWSMVNEKEKNFNWVFSLNAATKPNFSTATLNLVHGPDPKSTDSRVDYFYSLKFRDDTSEDVDIEFKEKFSYPVIAIRYSDEFIVNNKRFRMMLDGSLEKNHLDFDLDAKTAMKHEDDKYLKFKTLYNKKGIDSEALFEATGEDKGKFSAKLALPPKTYEASGTVDYKNKEEDMNVGVKATFKTSVRPEELCIDAGLVLTKKLLDGHTKVTFGNTDYVDIVGKLQNSPAIAGNLKIMVKDFVNGQGQLKVNPQDDKGTCTLVVDMLKTKRKVKLDGTFTLARPQYTANFDLFYDFGKDNAKKVTFSTNTKLEERSVNSKNSVAYDNQKVDFVVDATVIGSLVGKQKGFVSVSHSEGRMLKLQFNRDVSKEEDVYKGSMDNQLTYVPGKGSKPYTLSHKANIDTGAATHDEHVAFVNPAGEDLHVKWVGRSEQKTDRTFVEAKSEVSGALWPNTLNVAANFDFDKGTDEDKGDLKYKIKGSYGPKTNVEAHGSLNYATLEKEDKKIVNEFNIGFSFPLDKPQDVKYGASFYLFIPKDESHIETKSSMNAIVNNENYKYDFEYLLGTDKGNYKLALQVPRQDKFLLESNYDTKRSDEKTAHKSRFNLEYGKNQKLSMDVNGNRVQGAEGAYKISILLPTELEKAKKIDAEISYKKTSVGGMIIDNTVFVDGEKYTLKSNTDFGNPKSGLIDIQGTCPHSKPFVVYMKATFLGDNDAKLSVKLANVGTFNMDLDVETQVRSVDEFALKVYVDCEKLQLNKLSFEAVNEATSKGAKKIDITAKEDGKNIVTGSTTYQSRQEGNKFTMEGSGSLKIKNEQKSTSFKYIKDRLVGGNEEGVEIFFNFAVGEKSYVIEHRRTNLIYKLSHAYCEEKKQCAHFDILRKINNTDRDRFVSEAEIALDLRKLGFVPEFGLQTKTELDRYRLPTHTFDVHVNLDKSKYHTQVYAKRVKDKYAAAFTVTMPQRVISLESSTSYVDSFNRQQDVFPLVHETAFYTNKQADPTAKTMLRASLDVKRPTGGSHETRTSADLIFTNPKLEKDMQIAGKSSYDSSTYCFTGDIVLDVFKTKNQKIVIEASVTPQISKEQIKSTAKLNINGKGLGFNIVVDESLLLSPAESSFDSVTVLELEKQTKASSISMELKPNAAKFKIQAPTSEIINFEVKTQNKGSTRSFESHLAVFNGTPLLVSGEVCTSPVSVKLNGGRHGSPQLAVNGRVEPTGLSEFKVEAVEGTKTNVLAHYAVKMENKQPKTVMQTNSDNIQKFMKTVRADIEDCKQNVQFREQALREQATKDYQRMLALLQGGAPNFGAVSKYVNGELTKIGEELNHDKSLQEFVKSLDQIIRTVSKLVADVTARVTDIMEKTVELVTDTSAKLTKVFNERIVPEVSAVYEQLGKSVLTIAQALVDIAAHYITALSTFLEKFSEELKPLAVSLHSIMHDVDQMMIEHWNALVSTCGDIWRDLQAQVEPILSELEKNWNSANMTEELVNAVKVIDEFAISLAPTPEVADYCKALAEYIIMCLRKEPHDDWEQIRALNKKYDAAVDSLVKIINVADPNDIAGGDMFLPVPITPGYFYNSGKPGTVSWNVVDMIMKEDLDDIDMDAVRMSSWNPIDMIPPGKLRGVISDGQHIFTYDSRHLTFPGDCRYVVSQDAVDGNFSIVLNMVKGNPKSIILVDKSGSEVEVTLDKKLLFKGAPHGFPLIKADTIAWKEQNTFTIMSQYGVRVKCGWALDVCAFEVSGYYMGKLRGLLGDGNNEPNDDFRLPSGQIVKSEADFGNAYALDPKCPKVKTVDHSHHHSHNRETSDICDEYFGDESGFAYCDLAVNIKNYRQACQHAVMGLKGEDATRQACSIAKAYSVACSMAALPIDLPAECVKCRMGDDVLNKGTSLEVTTPSDQADIIVAVETTKANEKTYKEMIVPLVSTIVDELKTKKVTDVNVHLVGVTPKMKYPIYYDSQNNKLQGCKIEFKDEQRGAKRESPITTNIKPVDYFLNNLTLATQMMEIELGLNNIHLTYTYLSLMDLRPKAMKTLIMVNSEPCWESETEIFQAIGVSFTETIMSEFGIVAHLIAPFTEFMIPNKPAATAIGFSDKFVFMMDDQKKAALTNVMFRKNLEHSDDVCISYAEETFGNVYSSSNYLGLANAAQKKVYLNKVSNTIVGAMFELELESACMCTSNVFTHAGFIKCRVENRIDNRKYGKN